VIPWTRELDKKVFKRYYHLYAQEEFKVLVNESNWNGVVFSHAHNHHMFGRKGGEVNISEVPVDLRE